MKATVINQFRCRLSKVVYQPGDIYEGNSDRIKELQDKGFIKAIQKDKTEKRSIRR